MFFPYSLGTFSAIDICQIACMDNYPLYDQYVSSVFPLCSTRQLILFHPKCSRMKELEFAWWREAKLPIRNQPNWLIILWKLSLKLWEFASFLLSSHSDLYQLEFILFKNFVMLLFSILHWFVQNTVRRILLFATIFVALFISSNLMSLSTTLGHY